MSDTVTVLLLNFDGQGEHVAVNAPRSDPQQPDYATYVPREDLDAAIFFLEDRGLLEEYDNWRAKP